MSSARLSFLAATVAVSFTGCMCGGRQPCAKPADCGGNQICLEIQECAPKCSSDAQCASHEKCSTGGGCVEKTGCGADTDCSGDKVCSREGATQGTCVQSCVTGGCPSTHWCDAKGHCIVKNADGGRSCGGQLFETTRSQANFLISFDKSGSMNDPIGGRSKWSIAVGAVKQVTAQHEAQIRFGLMLFPGASTCGPGPVSVPIGEQKAGLIAGVLDQTAPSGKTPIGGVLGAAAQVPELNDAARANYVLLMTDGMETCGGAPVTAAKALFSKGIKTYVVGFGGEVDPATLTAVAIEGGTARAATPRYYQADDAVALNAAMNAIAQGALGCDFRLNQTPPDPTRLFVYVNGQLVSRDPSRRNGWEYNVAGNRITLFGPVCDSVSNLGAKVQVVYGCPDDTLVEGGPGQGGFDAGVWQDDGGSGGIN